ncbi:MAG: Gfo/Idh/MocA family oxidoreductase [Pedobacter sp.]|uniref:Gfo/Idh/MocA family protein n=1 Tax=Pedobacter sp. TaxID=1411316 RepID=UPI003561FAEF
MYKVLVIGCGNIGAQYDIDNDDVQTHVKAWYLNSRTEVSIYDINSGLAKQVAEKYQCKIVTDTTPETLAAFDIISICTPTFTHYQLLRDAIDAKVKTIICEKPISNDNVEMAKLKDAYGVGQSKILVNYIRRFQPDFLELKEYINTNLNNEQLTNIAIRYQRGFVNNCSHAMDLLEFLMDSEITLNEVKIHNMEFDQFENDPTLSFQAFWNKTNISVLGLSRVQFSHFEVDLYFEKYKISIINAGNTIDVYKAADQSGFLQPLILQENLSKKKCLKNYMNSVILESLKLTDNRSLEDNFLTSINLNLKMLNYKNK